MVKKKRGNPLKTEEERKQEFVDGLRKMADFLEKNPDLIPWGGTSCFRNARTIDEFATLIKKTGGTWEKSADEIDMEMTQKFGPHRVTVYVPRNEVCERIQTGTRIETIPNPDFEVPTITQEVPVFEWVCPPSVLEKATLAMETEEN
jgi:hypothetical protein